MRKIFASLVYSSRRSMLMPAVLTGVFIGVMVTFIPMFLTLSFFKLSIVTIFISAIAVSLAAAIISYMLFKGEDKSLDSFDLIVLGAVSFFVSFVISGAELICAYILQITNT